MTAPNVAPLLDYGVTPSVDPVVVSTPHSAQLIDVVVTISAPAGSRISLLQFAVNIPTATSDAPTALSTTVPVATVRDDSDTSWAITHFSGQGVFEFKPQDPPVVVGATGFSILFSNVTVSAMQGIAEIEIDEWAVATGEQVPVTSVVAPAVPTLAVQVPKVEPSLFIGDLVATPSPVPAGQSATLSWNGLTADVTYAVTMDGGAELLLPPFPLRWTSPPLWSDAATFEVTGTSSINGQTQSVSATVQVDVEKPCIDEFLCVPNELAPGQWAELQWRTDNAEGVTLRCNDQPGTNFPPNSGPGPALLFQPQHGDRYSLVAYRGDPNDPAIQSAAQNLAFSILDPVVHSFTVDPPLLEGNATSAAISWNVSNAVSVRLNGTSYPQQHTIVVSPVTTTTYDLQITGVRGPLEPLSATIEVNPVWVTSVSASLTATDYDAGTMTVEVTAATQYCTGFGVCQAIVTNTDDSTVLHRAMVDGVDEGGGSYVATIVFDHKEQVQQLLSQQQPAWIAFLWTADGLNTITQQVNMIFLEGPSLPDAPLSPGAAA